MYYSTVIILHEAVTNSFIWRTYYMARACKYITRDVIGQYAGPDFSVMPMGIMSDVNRPGW